MFGWKGSRSPAKPDLYRSQAVHERAVLGHPGLRGAQPQCPARGRLPAGGGGEPTGPPPRPRQGAGGEPGQGARPGPRDSGVHARAHPPPAGAPGRTGRPGCRPLGGGGLRPAAATGGAGPAAPRLLERPRLPAAPLARGGPDPVEPDRRRCRDRRGDHGDGGGAGHRSCAAGAGHSDRPAGERPAAGGAAGRPHR